MSTLMLPCTCSSALAQRGFWLHKSVSRRACVRSSSRLMNDYRTTVEQSPMFLHLYPSLGSNSFPSDHTSPSCSCCPRFTTSGPPDSRTRSVVISCMSRWDLTSCRAIPRTDWVPASGELDWVCPGTPFLPADLIMHEQKLLPVVHPSTKLRDSGTFVPSYRCSSEGVGSHYPRMTKVGYT